MGRGFVFVRMVWKGNERMTGWCAAQTDAAHPLMHPSARPSATSLNEAGKLKKLYFFIYARARQHSEQAKVRPSFV